MVLRRDIERTLRLLHGHIDKLQAWGFLAGVLYCTRQGVIKTYGSHAITEVLKNHMGEIHESITSVNDQGVSSVGSKTLREDCEQMDSAADDHANGQDGQAASEMDVSESNTLPNTLKYLHVPALPVLDSRLEDNSFIENRSLASLCVKLSSNSTGHRVGWGMPENKPVWWPEHIPWRKRGVQMGVKNEDLKDIIRACYDHFRMPLCNLDKDQLLTDDEDIKPVSICVQNEEELMITDHAQDQWGEETLEVLKIANTDSMPAGPDNTLFLPLLKTSLDNATFTENRRVAVNCVKISMGVIGMRVGWGQPSSKPVWWPSHVPWTKRGVQLGVTNDNLKDVIRACYQHHGQRMYSEEVCNWKADGYVWLPEEATQITDQANDSSHSGPSDWTYDAGVETHGVQVPDDIVVKMEPVDCDDCPVNEESYEYYMKDSLIEESDFTSHADDIDIIDHTDINSNTMPYKLFLPILHKKLEDMLFAETKTLAHTCVKVSLSGNSRRIGWGHQRSKPVWWPHQVPWTKRGIQMGVTNDHLKDVIRACYQHHGQPLYMKHDSDETSQEGGIIEVAEIHGNPEQMINETNVKTCEDGLSVPNTFSAFAKSKEVEDENSMPKDNVQMCDFNPDTKISNISRRSLHKSRTLPKKYSPGKIL